MPVKFICNLRQMEIFVIFVKYKEILMFNYWIKARLSKLKHVLSSQAIIQRHQTRIIFQLLCLVSYEHEKEKKL